MVLEEAPAGASACAKAQPALPQLLVFSARNATALSALLAAHAKAFEANPELALEDIAFTLRHGRKAFSHRQSLVADDVASAAAELHRLAAQKPSIVGSTPSPVFLFPGQGSQYAGMGKDLYERLELFRAPFDACADRLSKIMQRDFRADLFAGHEDIQNTEFAQPALFAVEYALAKAWMAQGVIPQALHGHSIGEYVAACLAGVFDLDTALSLVVARGRLMQQAAPGAMLAVVHPDAPIDRWLGADIALAASNAPGLSVVSGSMDAITRLETELKQARYATRRLKTGHAFHSPMMAQAAARYLEELRHVRLSPPSIAMISNVTGTWLSPSQATDPNYWAAHLEQTVRFDEGMRTLSASTTPSSSRQDRARHCQASSANTLSRPTGSYPALAVPDRKTRRASILQRSAITGGPAGSSTGRPYRPKALACRSPPIRFRGSATGFPLRRQKIRRLSPPPSTAPESIVRHGSAFHPQPRRIAETAVY